MGRDIDTITEKFIWCVFTAITLLLIIATQCLADGLTLHVELNKDTFLVHERIWVRWVLTNNTDKKIYYSDWLGPARSTMQYDLVTDEGCQVQIRSSISVDTGPPYWRTFIPPKDSLTNDYVACDCELLEKYKNIEAGTYRFTITIRKDALKGQPAIKSNAFAFSVVTPSDRIGSGLDDFEHLGKDMDYSRFLKYHPNSVYAPYVFAQMASGGAEDSISMNLIEEYPDDPQAEYQFVELLNGAENSVINQAENSRHKQWVDFALKMADNYPMSRVGKVAQALLDRKKKHGTMFGFGAWPSEPIPRKERIRGIKYPER